MRRLWIAIACSQFVAACPDETPTCLNEVERCADLMVPGCDCSANDRSYRRCLACRESDDTCTCVLLDEEGREVARAGDDTCHSTINAWCEYED